MNWKAWRVDTVVIKEISMRGRWWRRIPLALILWRQISMRHTTPRSIISIVAKSRIPETPETGKELALTARTVSQLPHMTRSNISMILERRVRIISRRRSRGIQTQNCAQEINRGPTKHRNQHNKPLMDNITINQSLLPNKWSTNDLRAIMEDTGKELLRTWCQLPEDMSRKLSLHSTKENHNRRVNWTNSDQPNRYQSTGRIKDFKFTTK